MARFVGWTNLFWNFVDRFVFQSVFDVSAFCYTCPWGNHSQIRWNYLPCVVPLSGWREFRVGAWVYAVGKSFVTEAPEANTFNPSMAAMMMMMMMVMTMRNPTWGCQQLALSSLSKSFVWRFVIPSNILVNTYASDTTIVFNTSTHVTLLFFFHPFLVSVTHLRLL